MKTSKFKMTELGPIPEEWEVKPFSECFTLIRNNTYARECLTDHPGSVVNVHYGDVLIKYGAVLDFAKNAVPYLKSDVKPNKDMLRDGDLVFADTAEDEAVGKAVEVQGLKSRMAVAGLHTVASRPHDGLFAPRYLGYYINSAAYHNQLLTLITGTKVSSVSRAGFLSTYVAIPPKGEQERIAETLSDVDALLSAMATLIEKKRAIKQGAMQELLGMRNGECGMRNVPRRRLPGFSGEWVEKRLGDVCSITTGHKDVNEGCENGLYPFFTCSRNALTSNQYSFDTEAILVAGNGDVGNLHYYCGKFEAYQRTYVLSDFMIYARYLWYELQFNLMNRLNDGKIGSTIPYIVLGQLLNYNFRIPPTFAEQRAIAEVLSDMDAEIEAWEAKRAKYESIKQGMMQELLTGKTRLV
jgi:type I restriction enzyme S subunit